MAKKEIHTPSYVLDSARQDKLAQDQRDEMLRSAIAFIVELCEHAGAIGEPLPRGYRVVAIKGKKIKLKFKSGPRVELRQIPGLFALRSTPIKVATVQNGEVELLRVETFIRHINDKLMDDIGTYFVARYQHNRNETLRLGESLKSVDAIRKYLDQIENESS